MSDAYKLWLVKQLAKNGKEQDHLAESEARATYTDWACRLMVTAALRDSINNLGQANG
jgi:hypothetical protein